MVPVATNPGDGLRRHTNTSSTTTDPPRSPSTADTRATPRRPSGSRAVCTMRSRAPAICSRTWVTGRSTSDMSAIVSSLDRRSRGEFACAVDIEPSCPVFMAWSMSRASPPRTSPTRIRSGRIRRAFRTSCRTVTSPAPSTLGGRASRETTCGWGSRSSAASSMVMSRSPGGMNEESTPSNVVFPVPVPPETTMFALPLTLAARNSIIGSVRLPIRTRSSGLKGRSENLRMVTTGPQSERGGITTFTREPSASRASTYGDDSSTRRPSGLTIRSIRWSTCASPSNHRPSTFSIRPFRSTYTSSAPLTMTSLTSGSLSNRSTGPRPTTSSETWLITSVSASEARMARSSRSTDSTSSRTRSHRSGRAMASSSACARPFTSRARTRPFTRSASTRGPVTLAPSPVRTPARPAAGRRAGGGPAPRRRNDRRGARPAPGPA